VDPASYAAFTASSPGWPPISAAKLTAAGGAIVSPQVSSDLAGDSGTLQNSIGLPSLTIHVAGTVAQTPALPGNAAFIIVNLAALRDPAAVQPNILLLNGGGIDPLALRSLVASRVPGATVTARGDVLSGLADAPLQHGADAMFLLAVIAAALLAIAALGCELAYGAADREYTLARLAAMGLTARQRIALIAGELAPGLLAAAVAAGVTTVALPRILAPALNLSVFTGSSASVTVTPDATSYIVPLAALVLLAAAATAAGARQRDIGPRLRTGG
jgi:putative ABC transport system permease protein